ncbi:hypothetical protein Mal4_36860 [Maioricimonas rarisocia]|uniref:Uncharacterized protein n=1 Tax=Maioricimonas rarisocia TaxID=2528026 RepID=A0A517ZA27_9PLAN|nr:hypothetical protein Mal4_36860 [Maioricimonas rarisocia]
MRSGARLEIGPFRRRLLNACRESRNSAGVADRGVVADLTEQFGRA